MTSALLACAMARRGYHCGILDADITSPSIPKLFIWHPWPCHADEKDCWPIQSRMGIDVDEHQPAGREREDPVVWRGPADAGAVKQFWTDVVWKDVDFPVCGHASGNRRRDCVQEPAVDGIVVVASPQELVSMIVAKAVNMAEMMKIAPCWASWREHELHLVCPDCGKKISVFGESHVDGGPQKRPARAGQVPHRLPSWLPAPMPA